MTDFTTEVRVYTGYDHRDESDGKRGAHNLSMDFILRGPEGAVNWILNTGWVRRPLAGAFQPGQIQDRRDKPGAGAVSSHLSERREDWHLGPNPCPIIGGECYGDTGYTAGDEVLDAMFDGGHEGVWAKLREFYDAWVAVPDHTDGSTT